MDLFEQLYHNSEFWLPENTTWKDISEYNSLNNLDLSIPIYLAILIYLIRIIFERLIGIPLGLYLNIKDNPSFEPNPVLESYYTEQNILSESIILFLSKETGLNFDNIKDWFEARRVLNRPSKLRKFTESLWRFVFYLIVWFYGIYILNEKPWFTNTKEFWIGYPKHTVTDDLYWYYAVELSFYLSLLVTQFFDVRRKDFWQMFVHHIVTITLLVFSYICNFVRVGSIILLLHDSADFWLELAKMTSYASYKRVCDTSFIIFTLVWLVTRLTFYPLKILYSTTFETYEIMGVFPACSLFNILLYALQMMHVIWFFMIMRVAFKAIIKGKVEKDDRSESEESN